MKPPKRKSHPNYTTENEIRQQAFRQIGRKFRYSFVRFRYQAKSRNKMRLIHRCMID